MNCPLVIKGLASKAFFTGDDTRKENGFLCCRDKSLGDERKQRLRYSVPLPQVIEIITHIYWTVVKFPKKCVILCITGTAMKCPSVYEAVGHGFVFKRVCAGSHAEMGLKAIETVGSLVIPENGPLFITECVLRLFGRVFLSFVGTNEQVVDIKTRSSAMKWPTAVYESFGPGFDVKRLCAATQYGAL
ncbi:hypothetical protein ISN44_As13g009540 [Arabidopsis suecica]|uniref:Uncharacterized protein n=1 Tax=Arabidopsis suecica TaxID=45249 RepID=A0A8T1XQ74_ARASU|nr:hypothetical protein ISN44_As13g009540 [Arabidopsis suecica]